MDESVSWNYATRGWTVTGPGGVHGKATFNLLGGYVEFDMDTTHATAATNTNFYTSSPEACCAYCDIQPNGSPQCVEMDIIENNGNCAMATTWHTCATNNPSGLQCASEGDCNQGGCAGHMQLPGGLFHVRADFGLDGAMTVRLNGAVVDVSVPSTAPGQRVAQVMSTRGAMFHSTQWQGWVPSGWSCPAGGDLDASRFSVSNVTIQGSVVQGNPPAAC